MVRLAAGLCAQRVAEQGRVARGCARPRRCRRGICGSAAPEAMRLLVDGQGSLLLRRDLLCADFAATGWWMAPCAGVGQGGGGLCLLGVLGIRTLGGVARAPPRPLWDAPCNSSQLGWGAGASNYGAPCPGRVGVWGSWVHGGWTGSWWGRQRRRQRVEEGRDVSGKSWGGST